MLLIGNVNKRIGWFLLIITGVALVVFYFINPEKSVLLPKCPFYVWTGMYCAGCGSQRAIHSFLHLRILEGLHYNFLVLPAGIFIVYHLLRPFVKKIFGIKLPDFLYHTKTPWILLAIIVLFWICRNIPVIPFKWLAPV